MTEQEKTLNPPRPLCERGKRSMSKGFHPDLAPQCGMMVYPGNIEISEKE